MKLANIDLKIEISKAGLTQKDVAEMMGISREYLSSVLRHEPISPDLEHRIRCAIAGDLLGAFKPKKPTAAQMPVEPIRPTSADDPWFKCGTCKGVLETCQYRYCPWCGKAVKWGA